MVQVIHSSTLDTSFKLLNLAKHLKNSGVEFNLYSYGQEIENAATVISYQYSRDSVVLYLNSGNSYKLACNEIEEIGCDAILLGYENENLDVFKERIAKLKDEKPHVLYIKTFENNSNKYDRYAWSFNALKY